MYNLLVLIRHTVIGVSVDADCCCNPKNYEYVISRSVSYMLKTFSITDQSPE